MIASNRSIHHNSKIGPRKITFYFGLGESLLKGTPIAGRRKKLATGALLFELALFIWLAFSYLLNFPWPSAGFSNPFTFYLTEFSIALIMVWYLSFSRLLQRVKTER